MTHRHLKIISGGVAVFFFVGSVLASSVFGIDGQSSTVLSEEAKRLIMGAEKMKKRKKVESEKKASSHKKREKEKLTSPKKKNRGGD